MIKFLTKYHKWLSISITIFILLFAISGIVLNHRSLVSLIDVNRNLLPEKYQYNNWNLGSVKGMVKISEDKFLIYGNIGIYLTDKNFNRFQNFNAGFGKGVDNHKVYKVIKTHDGKLFAGTLFGLFCFDDKEGRWEKIPLKLRNPAIMDIIEVGDTLYVLSRSFLFKSTDFHTFHKFILPPPEGYDNKVGLFKTLWLIHSGEIYGSAGKLIVDMVGIIFTFLTITGLFLFVNSYRLKDDNKKRRELIQIQKSQKWNLKWHNRVGWINLVVLIITVSTGMFLRPPLLISISTERVKKIPHTILDTNNAWFDKLRGIVYDDSKNCFYIATINGVYCTDIDFNSPLKYLYPQPPISVMGVNVFKKVNKDEILIGSFEGLFLWNVNSGSIHDYIKKKPLEESGNNGSQIGDELVSGYILNGDMEIYFDFNKGAKKISGEKNFPSMPPEIKNQPMSLWNVMLEIHTGRIFEPILGLFYILIVPLVGLTLLFILISGFIVWFTVFRGKNGSI